MVFSISNPAIFSSIIRASQLYKPPNQNLIICAGERGLGRRLGVGECMTDEYCRTRNMLIHVGCYLDSTCSYNKQLHQENNLMNLVAQIIYRFQLHAIISGVYFEYHRTGNIVMSPEICALVLQA